MSTPPEETVVKLTRTGAMTELARLGQRVKLQADPATYQRPGTEVTAEKFAPMLGPMREAWLGIREGQEPLDAIMPLREVITTSVERYYLELIIGALTDGLKGRLDWTVEDNRIRPRPSTKLRR